MLLLTQEDEMEREKGEVRHNRRREDRRNTTPRKVLLSMFVGTLKGLTVRQYSSFFPDINGERVAIKSGVG